MAAAPTRAQFSPWTQRANDRACVWWRAHCRWIRPFLERDLMQLAKTPAKLKKSIFSSSRAGCVAGLQGLTRRALRDGKISSAILQQFLRPTQRFFEPFLSRVRATHWPILKCHASPSESLHLLLLGRRAT